MLEKTLTFKQIIIGGIFICVGFAFGIGLHATAWVNPTVAPPGGNVPGPLNTGAATQNKAGGLNIGGKVTSASTVTADPGNTLTTKDYVDAAVGGGHVRGGHYGYCGTQLAADISSVLYAAAPVWPMTSCGATPTCADGFTPVQNAPYGQLNSSYSGHQPSLPSSDATMINKFNTYLDADTFIVSWVCIKT